MSGTSFFFQVYFVFLKGKKREIYDALALYRIIVAFRSSSSTSVIKEEKSKKRSSHS